MIAGQEEDEAYDGLWEARRMLWRAHQGGWEHLEYRLRDAVADYKEDQRKAHERAEEAERKADARP